MNETAYDLGMHNKLIIFNDSNMSLSFPYCRDLRVSPPFLFFHKKKKESQVGGEKKLQGVNIKTVYFGGP